MNYDICIDDIFMQQTKIVIINPKNLVCLPCHNNQIKASKLTPYVFHVRVNKVQRIVNACEIPKKRSSYVSYQRNFSLFAQYFQRKIRKMSYK